MNVFGCKVTKIFRTDKEKAEKVKTMAGSHHEVNLPLCCIGIRQIGLFHHNLNALFVHLFAHVGRETIFFTVF